jgi:hypothetical protein
VKSRTASSRRSKGANCPRSPAGDDGAGGEIDQHNVRVLTLPAFCKVATVR